MTAYRARALRVLTTYSERSAVRMRAGASGLAIAACLAFAPAALAQEAPAPSATFVSDVQLLDDMGSDSVIFADSEGGSGGSSRAHSFEVYGFGQIDVIHDFQRVDPAWEDAFRPSKIPTEDGAFGPDGQTSVSVKQSRLGAMMTGYTAGQDYEVKVEFDMFGTGVDAGQTTFRLRHAYGRWGRILGGQTNTLFMDGDLFPNSMIDYWGPNGMVFVRTPQLRFYIADDDNFLAAIALEKPGNDIDAGLLRTFDSEVAAGLTNNEEWPDLTGQVRFMDDWGHVQVSGILRSVGFATAGDPDGPNGEELGWGINVGGVFTTGPATFRLGVVYGEGIASYMNDGGMDLAPDVTTVAVPPAIIITDVDAEAVPLLGVTAYADIAWSDTLSSAIGYSFVEVDNTNFQEATAFHRADYASASLLWTPASNIMTGIEALWGQREDNDGESGDDFRLQYSFKVSFSSGNLLSN